MISDLNIKVDPGLCYACGLCVDRLSSLLPRPLKFAIIPRRFPGPFPNPPRQSGRRNPIDRDNGPEMKGSPQSRISSAGTLSLSAGKISGS